MNSQDMKRVILLFSIALLLRLAFVGVWHAQARGEHLSADSYSYLTIAESLSQGKGFQMDGQPTARRPPLYPLFLSMIISSGLHVTLAVQIIQSLLGAGTCVLLYLLGRIILGPPAALFGAMIFAADYTFIRQTVSVMSETLFVFFLALAFLFLYRGLSDRQLRFLSGAGILFACALLTREVLIFYVPFLFFWIVTNSPRDQAKWWRGIVFLTALCLALSPWVVRNSFVFKRLVSITTTAGHSFYLSNNPHATGGSRGIEWEAGKDTQYPELSEKDQPLYTPQTDKYLMKEGVRFILDNPKKFMKVTLEKMINTWWPFPEDAPPITKWIQGLSYMLIMGLAAFGIGCTRAQWRFLLPLYGLFFYTFLLHAVLISGLRYRLPVMPFFMLFAGFALSTFLNPPKRKPAHSGSQTV